MSAQHTPGPWLARSLTVIARDARSTIVCEVSGSQKNPVAQADARLIAAAPELLEALRALLAERSPAAQLSDACQAARAAIAKATGGAT